MYTDKTRKVLVGLTKQSGILKTEDRGIIRYVGDPSNHPVSELTFKRYNIPLEELTTALANGHCLGQLYNLDDPFNLKWGTNLKKNWFGSSWIAVDIDGTDIEMQTMHNMLLMKPTFSMTSQSHQLPGKRNRYRLFYFFYKVLTNYDGFCKVVDKIIEDVKHVIDVLDDKTTKIDNVSKHKHRWYYGNPLNCQIETSWTFYDPTEFYKGYSDDSYGMTKSAGKEDAQSTNVKEEIPCRPKEWKKLLDCCLNHNYSIHTLKNRFRKKYHIRLHSDIEHLDNGVAFTLRPKNYIALQFLWANSPNGGKEIIKWHDGDGRRSILATQLKLLIYIHNFDIAIDQLVYHALYLWDFAYCNEDGEGKPTRGKNFVTPKMLLEMARNIYQTSDKEIKEFVDSENKNKEDKTKHKCSILVNPKDAERRGVSLRELVNEAQHQLYDYLWQQWVEILRPYVMKGISNTKLAIILKKEVGVEFSGDMVGRRVEEIREKYRKKVRKNVQNRSRRAFKTRKLSEKSSSTSVAPASVAPAAAMGGWSSADADADAFSSIVNKEEAILSIYHQNAVTAERRMDKANEARFEDALWKEEQFNRLYKDILPDKKNKERIREELSIGERTYYKLKDRRRKKRLMA